MFALALAASPSLARAETKAYPPCEREPTETDLVAAKGAFQAGNASFDEADYPRAIVYWEDAYRRDCTAHALLLNLARAYELNGDRPQAIVALQTYLERDKGAADREKIERRIEVLQKQIESERATAAPPPAAPAQAAAPAPSRAPSAPAPETKLDAAAPPRKKIPIAPLVVTGVGGAVAIVGGILYGIAWGDLKDAEKGCPNRVCQDDNAEAEADSARTRVNVSGAITLGGLAVAGGGLAWFFIARSQQASAPAAGSSEFVPLAGKGFAGLGYSGRF